jgi:hypothetical protein
MFKLDLWTSVNTVPSATRAVRVAAGCAVMSALVVAGFVAFGATSPWNLIDVGLYLTGAIGLWYGSRVSAVAVLAWYLFATVVMWSTTGPAPGFITLAWIMALGNGVRGAWALHRLGQGWRRRVRGAGQAALPDPAAPLTAPPGRGFPHLYDLPANGQPTPLTGAPAMR